MLEARAVPLEEPILIEPEFSDPLNLFKNSPSNRLMVFPVFAAFCFTLGCLIALQQIGLPELEVSRT